MNYIRRLILAVISFVIIVFAWCGAEYLIYGKSEFSGVDFAIAIMIALSISGRLEKGVEDNERKQEFAERFADEFIKRIKEGQETESGENGSREEV